MLAGLVSPERATVTNLICAAGRRHEDWTADYRLYAKGRVDSGLLFDAVRVRLLDALTPGAPLVVALDDTLVRKSGPRVDGVRWRRDPLGPAFQTNFVRGQRFVQFSGLWPLGDGSAPAIPLAFEHAPGAGKVSRDACAEDLARHREEQKQKCLNAVALGQMKILRGKCDPSRRMVFVGDGSYTNGVVIRGLPEGSAYLGRARRDLALHHPPEAIAGPAGKGRSKRYGAAAPTPEALRLDESVPWVKIGAYAAGTRHGFRVKTLGPVQWRKAGTDATVRVVVVAPLGYRLRKGGKLLYRQPAYLVCTDPDMPVADILQHYLHRWGIEVNFRDEKTLVGTGEAQVRTRASNATLPAVTVAAYAMLRVAALTMLARDGLRNPLSPSRWRRPKEADGGLPPTGELLRLLRFETLGTSLRPDIIARFANASAPVAKSEKTTPDRIDLAATLFAAA